MVIGDAVVIWRAWAIWKGSRLQVLVFIPMFLLLVSFIFAIIDLSCLGTQSFSVRSTIPEGSRLCQWGEPIAWAVSLLTNIVSTTLIAIKAWQYHQFLKSNSSHFRLRSKNQNILLLLVESGFIYCLFWLSQLILFFDIQDGSKTHLLENALGALGDQISGVYPTAIIILVNLQRSMADDVESDRTHRLQELSTIQFDADPIHASLKMPDFPPSTPPLESSVASRHIAERYQEGALSETDGLTLHGCMRGWL
ncbi:hypothetical protein BDZ89DRAFT_1062938 [Hymenopellis radicata]|nr:hypothetical protein BDZ89DRAFT_1062938 [Hymenopellis radicata]